MAWAPATTATDVQDRSPTSFLYSLFAALQSREQAIQAGGPLFFPVVGDDLQAYSFWNWAGGATVKGLLYRIYDALVNRSSPTDGSWVDYTLTAVFGDPASGPNGFPLLDITAARAVAGLPAVKYYTGGQNPVSGAYTALTVSGGGYGQLFRRQRYREVYTLTAVCDVHGNAAAAGQRAFLLENFTLVNPGTGAVRQYTGVGKRVRCVASGNWVRDESSQADLLDNTVATPGWCSPFANGHLALLPYCFPGDLLDGADVLNEVWGILDVMRWTVAESLSFTGEQAAQDSSAQYPTMAGVQADVAANWPAATPYFGLPFLTWTMNYDSGLALYGGGAQAGAGGVFTPAAALAALDKKVQFWLLVGSPAFGTTLPTGYTMDAQGTALDVTRLGKYWHWAAADAGPTPATSPASPTFGSAAAPPPDLPPDPASNPSFDPPSHDTAAGFSILSPGGVVLAKWNVDPAGFPCSVTA